MKNLNQDNRRLDRDLPRTKQEFEEGGCVFPRNVGLSPNYTALQRRRLLLLHRLVHPAES
jgi:hypothetical protein